MTRAKRYVWEHPVIAYFLLAYVITWSSWTPISYGYDRGLLELTPLLYTLFAAGSFGPLLAAGRPMAGHVGGQFVQGHEVLQKQKSPTLCCHNMGLAFD